MATSISNIRPELPMTSKWCFTDNYEPHLYRNGRESSPIQSGEHLRELLRRYGAMEPRVVIIEHPRMGQLFVGLGGPMAGVEYYPNPQDHRALRAMPNRASSDEDGWFVSEGEPSRFAAEYLLPVEMMIDIVTELVESGTLSVQVNWV